MLDPSNVEAAKSAFTDTYGGSSRPVTNLTPVQEEHSFDDLVRWFYILDRVLISAGIPPSIGSVSEHENCIRFGIRTQARIDLVRRTTREIGIPDSAVVFVLSNPQLLPCLLKDPHC